MTRGEEGFSTPARPVDYRRGGRGGGGTARIADAVRVTVVYWAHLADRTPGVGPDGHGAFARRSPNRPNPLSVCVCTLYGADGQTLRVGGLDAVDGSPVLDLKPSLQTER